MRALVLLLAACAFGAEISAELDRVSTPVLSPVRYTVRLVTESGEGTPSLPLLPELGSFDVRSASRTTSVSISEGVVRTEYAFTYLLVPKEEGVFTIPPSVVRVDDEDYRTRELLLRVGPVDESQTAEPGPPRRAFAKADVSSKEVWLGEQVNYYFYLYTASSEVAAQLSPPPFDGFMARSFPDGRSHYEGVGGVTYLVRELGSALFPLRAGKLTIPACTAVYRLDVFGPKLSASSDALQLTVKPLPGGAPEGFNGAVGSFTVTAGLSTGEVRQGEATTLRVEVSGRGDLTGAGAPVVRDVEGVLSITPSGSDSKNWFEDERLMSTRVWEYAVLALSAGELELPPVEYVFFNPSTGAYSTATSQPLRLVITPAQVLRTAAPLPPPKTEPSGSLACLPWLWRRPPWLAALLAPAVGLAVLLPARRLLARRAADPRRRALARLAEARRLARRGRAEEALALTDEALSLVGGAPELKDRVRRARFSGALDEAPKLIEAAERSLGRRCRLWVLLLLFLAGSAVAAGPPAAAPVSLTREGASASILYNRALEEAASENAGGAAIFAVRSLVLAPRDAETRRLAGAVAPFGARVWPVVPLGQNEAFAAAVVLLWCAFIAALLWKRRRGIAVGAAIAAIALLSLVGWRLWLEGARPAGAIVRQVEMRSQPGEPEGRILVELSPGVLLRVVETREDWVKIDAGAARRGWVPGDAVERIWPEG